MDRQATFFFRQKLQVMLTDEPVMHGNKTPPVLEIWGFEGSRRVPWVVRVGKRSLEGPDPNLA